MLVYRIAKEKYIKDLSGLGAKMYGGRWNRPGLAVLYVSHARSLAMLELIVHFTAKQALKQAYKFASIQIDQHQIVEMAVDISKVDLFKPNNQRLWEITDYYFTKEEVLCLKVPSVIIPNEFNYLINPNHAKFSKVKITHLEDALMDTRFLNIL